jgi:rhodanese-related sulfurtransferase
VALLPDTERLSAEEYAQLRRDSTDHQLVDIRPQHEFAICALPGAASVSWCPPTFADAEKLTLH